MGNEQSSKPAAPAPAKASTTKEKKLEAKLNRDVEKVERSITGSEKQAYLTSKGDAHQSNLTEIQAMIKHADVYDFYEEIKYLGGGGYSDVYLMEKLDEPGSKYAVKIMKQETNLAGDPETVNEIGLMLRAQHPNVVRMFEAYESPGQPLALVMEVIENADGSSDPPDLMSRLMNGPLSMPELAKVVHQTASGIHYLNTELNAFHRDLKPDNILVGVEGLDRTRVADFGHGRCVGGDITEDSVGTLMRGTPGYNAPEMIGDGSDKRATHGRYNKQVDVWSLGVITYMCASGAPPFPIAPGQQQKAFDKTRKGQYKPMEGTRWKRVAPECKELIRRMLTVDPLDRITMKEIVEDKWLNSTMRG